VVVCAHLVTYKITPVSAFRRWICAASPPYHAAMSHGPLPRLVASSAVALAIGAFSADAFAQRVGENKAGPFMGNIKIGPAVGLDDDFGGRGLGGRFGRGYGRGTQFATELEVAYAVDRGNNAYIGFNPQFQVSDYFAVINLTGTFQYDIQIIENKVKGLYLYPKVNVGVGIVPQGYGYFNGRGFCSGCDAAVFFDLQLEFGAKFNIYENFHVLAEPISFPLYIGEQFGAQYRFWLGCGFDI